jgi:hypothetical protein
MNPQDPDENADGHQSGEALDPRYVAALARVRPAAIFLIVVSALNLIGVLLLFSANREYREEPRAVWKERWDEFRRKQGDGAKMQEGGIFSPEGMRDVFIWSTAIWGLLTGVTGMLGLWGGVRMLSLRSYPLALTSAIVTAIPCLSLASCFLLGVAAGIWAFVVLLNAEVRAMFD